MSFGRMAEIRCDFPTPEGQFATCGTAYGEYGTVTQVRADAKRAGWRVGLPGGVDLCDRHAKEV